MKIDDFSCFQLRFPLPERYGDAQGLKTHRATMLVRLRTDDGLIGWGDISINGLNRQHLQDTAELVRGRDPRASAPLVERLGRLSPRIAGGIDVALADLRGKAAGVSLAMLLGGPFRAAQPAYASLQNASDDTDIPSAAVAEAEHAMSLGFTSLKMKIGWHNPATDLAWIDRVLSVLPDDVPLAIDANRALDLAAARRIAGGIRDAHRIMWFEEPLSNRIPATYRELRDSIPLPVAGAESIPFPTIRDVITRRDMDIINPDLISHGGFDRMQHLYALCEAHGVRLVPHCFDGQLMRIATLHLLAAWPDWEERHGFAAAPLEVDISPNPLRDDLLEQPLRPGADGLVAVPTAPGLGVVVNEDLVRRYGERLAGS